MGLFDYEIHHQYTIRFARYTIRLGSTSPKNTLLECTWYLVSLVDAHGPNYQCARCEYGPSPPKDTLLIVYLLPAISRGCYRVQVYDVLSCCQRCAV